MQVSPNNNTGPVIRAYWKASPPVPGGHGADTAQFDRATALNRSLADTPGVRPGEVERARELIGNVSYPPAETIKRIASLLAVNIKDAPADT
ncbi:MAG: hypothetical protein HZA92_04715 [Verrucomicrobia bacterium]|nr:hypothetical protein [Verrucomicrobiota bacterium]